MKTTCPHCGRTFSIQPKHVGRKGKCPKCGERFVVEEDASEAIVDSAEETKHPTPVRPAIEANTNTVPVESNKSSSLSGWHWLALSAIPASLIFTCCGLPMLLNGIAPPVANDAPAQKPIVQDDPPRREREQPEIPDGEVALAQKPLEYQLAIIDAGGWVAEDDLSVSRFRSLLQQLDERYKEDQQQIADMTVKAQVMLRDNGIHESMIHIMEGMNVMPLPEQGTQPYADFVSSYLVFRDQGQSHDDAVKSLQAVIHALTNL